MNKKKVKTTWIQHLSKIFIDCDTQKLFHDFENNNIQKVLNKQLGM